MKLKSIATFFEMNSKPIAMQIGIDDTTACNHINSHFKRLCDADCKEINTINIQQCGVASYSQRPFTCMMQ